VRQAVVAGVLAVALACVAAAVAGPSRTSGANFSLNPAKTQVTNTHQTELTIDAAGHSAHFDNSKSGGAHWQADYSWTIPSTLTTGKSATASIKDSILAVQPEQSLRDYMNIRGPDFAKQLIVDHPSPGTGTLNVTFPISAGYASSKELTITIEFISSSVVYHYIRTTGTGGRLSLRAVARAVFNEYGDVALSASGNFTTPDGTFGGCPSVACSLKLVPAGNVYGTIALEEWHQIKDLRVRFRIVSGRIDRKRGGGTKYAVDLVGKVVASSGNSLSGHPVTIDTCRVGDQVGVYVDATGASFGCGAILVHFKRHSFSVSGSALG
jgi:hypothetical protein